MVRQIFFLLFFLLSFAEAHAVKTADPRAIPYLLSKHHPTKQALDAIFSSPHRLIHDHDSLYLYGRFEQMSQRTALSLTKATHQQLKGFVIKTFLDTQPAMDELHNFIRRIKGANRIRQVIQKHGYERWFQVPQKYLYEIPVPPSPQKGTAPKKYLLVAENMQILSPEGNRTRWISDAVNEELLDALFVILTEVGLYDSLYIDNIPFCENGKIAFVDTEHHSAWPINYDKLYPSLRPGMQAHWHQLILHGGP